MKNTISSISSSRSSVSSIAVAPKIISEQAPPTIWTPRSLRVSASRTTLQNPVSSGFSAIYLALIAIGILPTLTLIQRLFSFLLGQTYNCHFRTGVDHRRHRIITHMVFPSGDVIDHNLSHTACCMCQPACRSHHQLPTIPVYWWHHGHLLEPLRGYQYPNLILQDQDSLCLVFYR